MNCARPGCPNAAVSNGFDLCQNCYGGMLGMQAGQREMAQNDGVLPPGYRPPVINDEGIAVIPPLPRQQNQHPQLFIPRPDLDPQQKMFSELRSRAETALARLMYIGNSTPPGRLAEFRTLLDKIGAVLSTKLDSPPVARAWVATIVECKSVQEVKALLPQPAPVKIDPEAAPAVDSRLAVCQPCRTLVCGNHPVAGIPNDRCVECTWKSGDEGKTIVLSFTIEQLRDKARAGGGWVAPSALVAERLKRANPAAVEAGKPVEVVAQVEARLVGRPKIHADRRAYKTEWQRENRKKKRLLKSQAEVAAIVGAKDVHPSLQAHMLDQHRLDEERRKRKERRWRT